jgi:hypothetical protein
MIRIRPKRKIRLIKRSMKKKRVKGIRKRKRKKKKKKKRKGKGKGKKELIMVEEVEVEIKIINIRGGIIVEVEVKVISKKINIIRNIKIINYLKSHPKKLITKGPSTVGLVLVYFN